MDPLSSAFGRVCGVEEGDFVLFVLEPVEHIDNSSLCCCATCLFSLGIVDIKELGVWMRIVSSPIGAHVEHFGLDRGPSQIALDYRVVSEVGRSDLGRVTHLFPQSDFCRAPADRP